MATQAKRPQNPQFTTPRGIFQYPKLNSPDFGSKDFPKPDGQYKVRLKLLNDVAAAWAATPALAAVIEQARADTIKQFDALPVGTRKKLKEATFNEFGTEEFDKETEEPTGYTLFSFAMQASGLRKSDGKPWSQKVGIFDSKGIHLKNPPEIWSGSEGCISFEAYPYFVAGTGAGGVGVRLKAVQLLKLVQGQDRDASAYGFAAQEGGFDSSEYEAPADDESDTPAGGNAPSANPQF